MQEPQYQNWLCRLLTHWFAFRLWVAGLIVLIIGYCLWITPNQFGEILENRELRVGYLKFPDNGYAQAGKNYGYELKLLERYAQEQGLSIKLEKHSPESMSTALNINKIDIGIGGITEHLIDTNLNLISMPWDFQTLCIIERRTQGSKPNANIDEYGTHVYVGKRFSDTQTIDFLETALPKIAFLSHVDEERDLIERLENDDIQYAVTTLGRLRVIQSMFPNIRRVKTFKEQKKPLVWMFPKNADKAFVHSINKFIANEDTAIFKRELSDKLFTKPKHFHFLDSLKLKEHIQTRLPEYEQWFKQAAKEYDLDWTLLAALAYQESRWRVEAVSPTKVRGIMQITTDTAKSLGVENRLDAFSTIFAGAKYLKSLRERVPKRVTEPDRTRMAVGAYNIGFGYILDAYKDARIGNFEMVTWEDIEERLPTVHRISQHDEVDYDQPTFPRGFQAIKYVSRIQEFNNILRYYAAD